MGRDVGVPTYRPLRMHGVVSDSAALPWSWVEDSLTTAPAYWVVGCAPGPLARPVWGVWGLGGLYLSLGSPRLRGLPPLDPVSVHLGGVLDVVIVEGWVAGSCDRADVVAAYDAKYRWQYDVERYGPLTEVAPARVLAWRTAGEAGRDGFVATGRWDWPAA